MPDRAPIITEIKGIAQRGSSAFVAGILLLILALILSATITTPDMRHMIDNSPLHNASIFIISVSVISGLSHILYCVCHVGLQGRHYPGLLLTAHIITSIIWTIGIAAFQHT